MSVSLFPYASNRSKQVQYDVFILDITGAVTQSPLPMDDRSCLALFAAPTQAVIDAHLGTSSEFTAAQFDATSLGADAQGILINMSKQVEDLIFVNVRCFSSTAGVTLVERACKKSTVLTDSSLLTEAAVGAFGNLGIKIDWGNSPDFDALTVGQVVVDIYWRAK